MSDSRATDDLPEWSRLRNEEAVRTLIADTLGEPVGRLETTYVRQKPGQSLLATYRLGDGRLVTLKEFHDPAAARDLVGRRPGARLSADGHVALFPFPLDPRLRSLPALVNRYKLARQLARMLGDESIGRDDLHLSVIRYKPERRCLLEVRIGGRTPPRRLFVRCLDRARAEVLDARTRALSGIAIDGFRLPIPLAFDPDTGAFVEPPLPGGPFERLLGFEPIQRRRLLELLARGLDAVHSHDCAELEAERLSDLLGRVQRTAGSIALYAPPLAAVAAALERSLRHRAERLLDGRTVALHGDLDPSQVLVTRTEVSLLDFERSVRGDPGRDLGGFVAGLIALDGPDPGRGLRDAATELLHDYKRIAPGALDRKRFAWHLAAGLAERALAAARLPDGQGIEQARQLLDEALEHIRSRRPTPGFGGEEGTLEHAHAEHIPAAVPSPTPLPKTGIDAATAARVHELRDPRALEQLLARVLPERAGLRLSEPRIWPKPGGRFVLLARAADGQPALVVYLFPRGRALPSVAPGTGVAVPDESLVVQVFPADFRLKHLPRLVTGIADWLTLAGPATVEALGYWPGKRALLRVTPAAGEPLFVKTYREPDAIDAARAAHDGLAATRADIRLPNVVQSSREPPWMATTPLAGRPLDVELASPRARTDVAAAGALLARLHAAPFDPGRRFTFDDELAVVRSAVAIACDLHPDLGRRLTPTWRRLEAVRPRDRTSALIHRDFHDGQLRIDADDDVGLLDLDTLARGPAALDLGNFEAHLILRDLEAGGDGKGLEEACQAFRAGYGAAGGTAASGVDLGFYRTTALLRLASVYRLRPTRPGLPEALAEAAARAVERCWEHSPR